MAENTWKKLIEEKRKVLETEKDKIVGKIVKGKGSQRIDKKKAESGKKL